MMNSVPKLWEIIGNDFFFLKGQCLVTIRAQCGDDPSAVRIWHFWSILPGLFLIKCLLYTGGSFQRTGAKRD